MDETNTSTNTSKMNPMFIVGVIVLIAVGGFIFMQMNKKTESAVEQNMEQTTGEEQQMAEPTLIEESPAAENPTGAMENKDDTTSVKTITIDAGSFYYKPNVITVKKGTKVKIVMTSKDMMHDFNIDELKVKIPVTKAGNTATVEFTADKVGTFEYYCSVGQHRKNGQVGSLIVE